MSAPHIILASLPSLCQKLSELVKIWRCYNKNNFAWFFLRHGVEVTRNEAFAEVQQLCRPMNFGNVGSEVCSRGAWIPVFTIVAHVHKKCLVCVYFWLTAKVLRHDIPGNKHSMTFSLPEAKVPHIELSLPRAKVLGVKVLESKSPCYPGRRHYQGRCTFVLYTGKQKHK